MRRLSIVLAMLCGSCAGRPSISNPEHAHFHAEPAFGDKEYNIEVTRSDSGGVVVVTVLRRSNLSSTSAARALSRKTVDAVMKALQEMTERADVNHCTDSTRYFVSVWERTDSLSVVTDSCSKDGQRAAAELDKILVQLFPSIIPKQLNWAEPADAG